MIFESLTLPDHSDLRARFAFGLASPFAKWVSVDLVSAHAPVIIAALNRTIDATPNDDPHQTLRLNAAQYIRKVLL